MAAANSTTQDPTAHDKVLCRTPTPGKTPTRVPRWKFDALRAAILDTLPASEPGMAFTDLRETVRTVLPADMRAKLGSLGWHVTTVKLELEVAGEIARVPGSTPQRLIRTV